MLRVSLASSLIALTAVVASASAFAAEPVPSEPQTPRIEVVGPLDPIAAGARRYLDVGDPAPDFSYLGTDGNWHELRGLLAGGDLLLVFGASDEVLLEIESARSVFIDLGVTPVAVLDMSSGSASRHARRLDLDMPIVSDARCAIGGLYSALDQATRRHAPGFFLVDDSGTLRAFLQGTIPSARQLIGVAARALARPLPESARLLSKLN